MVDRFALLLPPGWHMLVPGIRSWLLVAVVGWLQVLGLDPLSWLLRLGWRRDHVKLFFALLLCKSRFNPFGYPKICSPISIGND